MQAVYLTSDLMFSSRVSGVAQTQDVQLDVAASVESAVEKIRAGSVRLVLIDLNMPGIVPEQVVPQLRQASGVPVQIVAYASHVHEGKLAAAQQAGCDLVLSRGQFINQVGALFADLSRNSD